MDSQETPTTSSSRGAAVNVPLEMATTGGHGNQPDARPDDIDNALEEPTASVKLQIMKDIDHKGDLKASISAPAIKASLPSDPAAAAPSKWKASSGGISFQKAKDQDIVLAQRTPTHDVKDVLVGDEVLVVNPSLMTIKTDQIEGSGLNREGAVNAFYDTRFQEFGLPPEATAAEELSQEVHTVKGPDHVPACVSEGRVATISMNVNKTGVANFVPSMEMRRSPAGEGAGELANLEPTSPQKHLAVKNSIPEALS